MINLKVTWLYPHAQYNSGCLCPLVRGQSSSWSFWCPSDVLRDLHLDTLKNKSVTKIHWSIPSGLSFNRLCLYVTKKIGKNWKLTSVIIGYLKNQVDRLVIFYHYLWLWFTDVEVFLSYGALRNLAKTLGHDDDLALAFMTSYSSINWIRSWTF